MDNLTVIDRFTEIFSRYIDSGFGLLTGEVAWLTGIIVSLDITLAGLFWALGQDHDVIARLVRKTLFVGSFALLLNHWAELSDIVFRSFLGLGLVASDSALDPAELMRPGFVAQTGFAAAWPLLAQAGELLGFSSLFDNLVTVAVLVLAWLLVLFAFFILSIQLFVTIVEFKLTCLAGFVLVPFALWRRTAFLAERVLGHVIGSGVKMMVLAVIIGIGSVLFRDLAGALPSNEPNLREAMALVLAALSLCGLGIFAPSLAAGLTAGAPQLSAAAAMATTGGVAAAGLMTAGTAGAVLAGGRQAAAPRLSALRQGSAIPAGTAQLARSSGMTRAGGMTGPGTTQSSASGSQGRSGDPERSGAPAAMPAPGSASSQAYSQAQSQAQSQASDPDAAGHSASGHAASGDAAAAGAVPGGSIPAPGLNQGSDPAAAEAQAPAWARRLRDEQKRRAAWLLLAQAIREGDRPAHPSNPDLKEAP